jgi:hypothetical protein
MARDDYRKGYRDGFTDAFDFLNQKDSSITTKLDIKTPVIEQPKIDTDIECMECGVIWSIDNNPTIFCKNITCPFK